MKTFVPSTKIIRIVALLTVSLFSSNPTWGATLRIEPSTVTSDYAGPITLSITALPVRHTVLIERYIDFNKNGVIDGADGLVQSFALTDGEASFIDGIRNSNVPGDEDGVANGQIRTVLDNRALGDLRLVAIQFVYKISSSVGAFTPVTLPFNVTEPMQAQSVTGRVTSNGSAVPNAFVSLLSEDFQVVRLTTFTDENGNFGLNVPVGENILISAKNGYISDFTSSTPVQINDGVSSTQDINLTAPDRVITGRLTDSVTGIGIGNINAFLGSRAGLGTAFATDSDGNFNIPIVSGEWQTDFSKENAAFNGYVWSVGSTAIDTSNGDVLELSVQWPKVNALIHGQLQNANGETLSGAEVRAKNDQGFEAVGFTDANGKYVLGVVAGNWEVSPSEESLSRLGFSSEPFQITVQTGKAASVNFIPQGTSLKIDPSTVTTEEIDQITLSISGVPVGETVLIEKYIDSNRNGEVDADDFLVQSFALTDGKASSIGGVRNKNVPGDQDGEANGRIQATLENLSKEELNRLAAQHVYRMSSDSGAFESATAVFNVTEPVYSQRVIGQVTSGGLAVPNAIVLVFVALEEGIDTRAFVISDQDGNFSANIPEGEYSIDALKRGYVTDFSSSPSVQIPEGGTATQNLTLIAADRNITGQFIDDTTGTGIGTVQIFAGSDNGLVTLVFADRNGNFDIPVVSGEWEMDIERDSAALQGYVLSPGLGGINTSAGDVSGITIRWRKVDALIHGRLQTGDGQPLAGLEITSDIDQDYEAATVTDRNGEFVLGVRAGNWAVHFFPSNEEGSTRLGDVTVAAGQAARADFTVGKPSSQTSSLNVAPSTVTSEYSGQITLTIEGLSPGQTVSIERYIDFNRNGNVDADDVLTQQFNLTDGESSAIDGVRNVNVPGDEDGEINGQIQAVIENRAQGLLKHLAAQFVYTVSNSSDNSPMATSPFIVTQPVHSQKVVGRVTSDGSPVANSLVVLSVPLVDDDLAVKSIVLTDRNGMFSINSSSGGFQLFALKTGHTFDFSSLPQVQIADASTSTQDLTLFPADRNITGQLTDKATGLGIGGILVFIETSDDLLTIGFTEGDGAFDFPVVSGEWEMDLEGESGALHGNIFLEDIEPIDTTAGSVTGLSIQAPKVEALIYGRLQDPHGNPLAGVSIWGHYLGYEESFGLTDVDGRYVLGVFGGSWEFDPTEKDIAVPDTLVMNTSATVALGEALRVDLALEHVTTRLKGQIVDSNGNPVSEILVIAYTQDSGLYEETVSDSEGGFDLPVKGGSWTLRADSDDADDRGLISPHLTFEVTDNVDHDNILLVAQNVHARINGSVRDQNGNPLSNVSVNAHSIVQGVNYNLFVEADASGSFSFGVFDGEWRIGVDCNDLKSRGFECGEENSVTVASLDQQIDFTAQRAESLIRLPIPVLLPDRTVEINLSLKPDRTYLIQGTSDLVNWIDLLSVKAPTGSLRFVDPDTGRFSHRFYRVREGD